MLDIEDDTSRRAVAIHGDMTVYQAEDLWQSLKPHLEETRPLHFDLAKVTNIDGSGIQLLALTKKHRKEKGLSTVINNHSQPVLNAIELLDLASYFNDPLILINEKKDTRDS